MGYDIYWHRKKETIPDLDTGKSKVEPYYKWDDKIIIEARNLHSNNGYLEIYKKPFTYEKTGLNITSNLSSMFSWAINDNIKQSWKYSIHGLKGHKVVPILKKAIKKMEKYPDIAKQYNSENGWGVYEDALQFLKDLLAESMIYKNAYLCISY
jgi:hypothetical protein